MWEYLLILIIIICYRYYHTIIKSILYLINKNDKNNKKYNYQYNYQYDISNNFEKIEINNKLTEEDKKYLKKYIKNIFIENKGYTEDELTDEFLNNELYNNILYHYIS
jgi:hypothetical protein